MSYFLCSLIKKYWEPLYTEHIVFQLKNTAKIKSPIWSAFFLSGYVVRARNLLYNAQKDQCLLLFRNLPIV